MMYRIVVDFVFDYKEEDYHEKIVDQVITDSDIPLILRKYGYNFNSIRLNDSKWQLLEQAAPELCADRVDYTLRDMFQYGHIILEDASNFLDHLIVLNGKNVSGKVGTAEWFVRTYYTEVIDFFMNPLNI